MTIDDMDPVLPADDVGEFGILDVWASMDLVEQIADQRRTFSSE